MSFLLLSVKYLGDEMTCSLGFAPDPKNKRRAAGICTLNFCVCVCVCVCVSWFNKM